MLLKDIFSFGEITLLSEGRGKGPVKFRGIFSECERPNGNKRIYSRTLLEREVKKLQSQIGDRRLLGELDHPSDEIVHLGNVSHVITNLRMQGNHVMGRGRFLIPPLERFSPNCLKLV